MHRFILIFGFVLLPYVATLKCYKCAGSEPCDASEECAASITLCGASRITTYADGIFNNEIIMKSCIDRCSNGSINFGISRTVITSKCCTSELCNTQSAPEPTRSTPNGRKCHTCGQQSCDGVLNCEGSEDHCISASVPFAPGQSMTMKGCASAHLCGDLSNLNIPGSDGMKFSCCQGDNCNSASTSSASLLLLVAPFIPLITFS